MLAPQIYNAIKPDEHAIVPELSEKTATCATLPDTLFALTLSRHYWVVIQHGGALGVHESLWVRDHFW
jgi:hypothetical protein